MIRLSDILQEILVGPVDALAQRKIQEYIKNGSQGDLDLEGTEIQYLPKDLKVGGSLYLSNCKNLKSLPNGLTVGHSLNLNATLIQSLPNDLKVGGWLTLSNTQIESLPEDLKVRGGLFSSNTPIQSLPNGLEVGGSLDLSNCENLKSLPKGLKVGGYLDLRNTPLAKKYTTEEQLKAKYSDLKVEKNIFI